MSIAPLRFTGISSYSTDFQTILDRAVQIAQQPITFLQNDQTKILQQKTLAGSLSSSVDSLASAVKALGALGDSRAVGGSSSDTTKVSIGTVTSKVPASYTISEITSLARSASATSAGYADGDTTAVSATGTVELKFGTTTKTLTLGSGENTLAGLRDKINGLGIGLNATILTTGTGSNPYYLSITSSTTGEKPITLVDDPTGAATNLLAASDAGADASFKINGVPVSKSSNYINDVVNGVSFTLKGTTTGSDKVTLSLASSSNSISTKLEAFVSAYNDVLSQTDAQIGESAGLLTGSFIVRETKNALRGVAGYQSDAGTVRSLAALGITFGRDGKASFDSTALTSLSDAEIQSAFDFFGSSTSGFGALQRNLTQLSDPVTGLISLETARLDESDKRIQERVDELTTRVTTLQSTMSARLALVDASLGSLETQKSIVEASIQNLNYSLYGKNPSN